ncbi:anaerobic nitric oxide reductase flavorubredoxin [Dethiobacter alkaliphilus]|uniref:anaerobic nitric oxide reductase flavorubredoxin n=1 Tax=Dethiobacter alkaliphilus TaxID=427926 RepID=UPI0022266EA5|nr:anaerobic nitric oxide reductase flavorubredoxin [Dethiobacter alkaliphilus]MCW3489695.1 anaerobic nitric oxide reductase flavorubredoxin [Dethiobacter alkaliphilus]
MSFKITDSVTWVGKVDWDLRRFHGHELSTHRGSTYNSYLVRDEKNVLIDTAWTPFAHEYVDKLAQEIDLDDIDFIVANHSEVDHSGALAELMKRIPDTPIYCSQNGAKMIKAQMHQDWNFKIVKTGDKINLGSKELIFIEAPMLHWPDSMFCYLTGEAILFSNDAFGQHYATEVMFNDLVDKDELYQEALKYYANILTPFSRFVPKKVAEFNELNLPLNLICPSHGVIWRDNPLQIVEQYAKWADNYQENQVAIIYDTMWNSTKKMAEAIAEGLRQQDETMKIKLFNLSISDKNDVVSEVFKSKGILVGSSTINRGILSGVAGFLEEIKGLGFKDKKAAAFGSYGWSGESVGIVTERLKECGFTVESEGLKALWNPDQDMVAQCRDFGKEFVK